ncbi:MAG: DUF1223 domain-containing protein [Caulobacteraceae bacterium]
MRFVTPSFAAALAISTLALAQTASARTAAKPPVVVELFTAQGCSGCPQADLALNALADRKDLIALSFPVDYWDYVGWKDTFAQPAFADRQRAYANRLKVRELYTPEMVVDGAKEASGLDHDGLDGLIKAADPAADAPKIRFGGKGARIDVGAGEAPASSAEVWLIRYDPTLHEVKVKAGENKGKTVMQRNVVRDLVHLGRWAGKPRSFTAPAASEAGLNTVVLVQAVHGGKILAAAAG